MLIAAADVPAPEYCLVLPEPSAHPRLLCHAADLLPIRQRLAQPALAPAYAALRQLGEHLLDPAHPQYLNHHDHQHDLWVHRHGIFQVVNALETLAILHLLTGDARYAVHARDTLMALIDHGLAEQPTIAYGEPYPGWRRYLGHDKGKLARACAWVYDTCFAHFTVEQRQRFAAFARESIEMAQAVARGDMDQVANNRGVRGLLVAPWYYLALEGDGDLPQDPKAIYRTAESTINLHLCHTMDVHGAPYEGANYVVLGWLASLLDALERRGLPTPLRDWRFERLSHYFLYELLPGGGSVNNLNDCDHPAGSATHFLHLLGTPAGALIPWLTRQLDLHPTRSSALTDAQQIDPGRFWTFARWWDQAAPVRTPAELGFPVAHHFPQRGIACLRTGWDRDDLLASHFCGRQERRCHRQGDYNHVSFYALGECFLADAGYGQLKGARDMTQAVDRWYQDTQVHNCVMLNGRGFRTVWHETGWGEGQQLDFIHTDQFDSALGDAAGAVAAAPRARRALRRTVLVKAGPARYLAVIDVNELDNQPVTAQHTWQTLPGQTIALTDAGFVIRAGAQRCEAVVFSPQKITRELGEIVLPQVRLSATAPVTEMVTLFVPRQAEELMPRMTIERLGVGEYVITCALDGQHSRLHASTTVVGPLQKPMPITLT